MWFDHKLIFLCVPRFQLPPPISRPHRFITSPDTAENANQGDLVLDTYRSQRSSVSGAVTLNPQFQPLSPRVRKSSSGRPESQPPVSQQHPPAAIQQNSPSAERAMALDMSPLAERAMALDMSPLERLTSAGSNRGASQTPNSGHHSLVASPDEANKLRGKPSRPDTPPGPSARDPSRPMFDPTPASTFMLQVEQSPADLSNLSNLSGLSGGPEPGLPVIVPRRHSPGHGPVVGHRRTRSGDGQLNVIHSEKMERDTNSPANPLRNRVSPGRVRQQALSEGQGETKRKPRLKQTN